MNFIRISVASLDKKSLKDIENVINDETDSLPFHFKHMQWYIAILNNNKLKLYKPELPKITKKPADTIYNVQFSNKKIQLINLSLIFSNGDVTSLINSSIIFNFNYNKVNFEANIDGFFSDSNYFQCDYGKSLILTNIMVMS